MFANFVKGATSEAKLFGSVVVFIIPILIGFVSRYIVSLKL